jgi:outer membrane protein OmpA-like peptidoglycan-associated protein
VRLAGGLTLLALAAAAMGQQRSFVACPIVRDTKTVPCFLAEYDGELYYLGIQQDITAEFHPPQLKHEVLVEGRVAQGPRVCGGIPLQPLSISVIKEVNPACNTLLPAEPSIEAPAAARGAGPASRRIETGSEPIQPKPGKNAFVVLYAFNDDYLDFAGNRQVSEAVARARQIGGAKVSVSGYRGTSVLSDGSRMVEKAGLAEKRAQSVATILRGLGVTSVTVQWKDDAEPGDGQNDASRRRVDIAINP